MAPFYWTGWLFLKIVSRCKYPNDDLSDLPTTLMGIAISLIGYAIYMWSR